MYDVGLSGCFRDRIFLRMPFEKTPKLDAAGKELILVLDPSSSQTGIAVGTSEDEILLFQDFKNLAVDKKTFTAYLNDYLIRLCKNNNITRMVYEVTFDRSRGDIASVVLSDLEDNFKTYCKVIPSLSKDDMFPILPSVWRKNFLKSKEYNGMRKNRTTLKEVTRKECVKRYPQYYDYFFKDPSPPDSTDAIGIFHGFMEEYWFDKSQNIKRVSKVNSRYSRNHTYRKEILALPTDVLMQYIMTKFAPDIEVFAYNPDLSLTENVEIVTSQTDKSCALLALDSTSRSLLRWSVEYGDAEKDSNMYAVACQRTHERRS